MNRPSVDTGKEEMEKLANIRADEEFELTHDSYSEERAKANFIAGYTEAMKKCEKLQKQNEIMRDVLSDIRGGHDNRCSAFEYLLEDDSCYQCMALKALKQVQELEI